MAEIFEMASQLEKETPFVENLCSLAYHDPLTGLTNLMFLEALLKYSRTTQTKPNNN